MKRFFNQLSATFISLALLLGLVGLTAGTVYAAGAKDSVCQGIGLVSGDNGCETPAGSKGINDITQIVVNTLSIVVGFIAVIMIIIGGLKYVTSSGDSNNVSSAKNTILYAIVGLVIVALAQVIVRFVLKKV